MAKVLLEYGADVNVKSHVRALLSFPYFFLLLMRPQSRATPLLLTCHSIENPELVTLLLDNGADLEQQNNVHFSFFLCCSIKYRVEYHHFKLLVTGITSPSPLYFWREVLQSMQWIMSVEMSCNHSYQKSTTTVNCSRLDHRPFIRHASMVTWRWQSCC
jgi:hypothetical protein